MLKPTVAHEFYGSLDQLVDEVLAQILLRRDEHQTVGDVHALTKEYALDGIGRMFFGTDFNTLQGDKKGKRLLKLNKQLFEVFSAAFYLSTMPWIYQRSPYLKKLLRVQGEISAIAKAHIDDYHRRLEQDPALAITMLGKLIKSAGTDIANIMAQDALIAGTDTTSSASTFLLYHLATNPQTQAKLYNEIRTAAGTGELTVQKLNSLKYLRACIQESLRINPIAIGAGRLLQKPMVLSGYYIPEGELVTTHTYLAARHSTEFDEPDRFIPERWLRTERTTSCPGGHHPFASLPFGHGPRVCIGQRFAQLELKMLISKVIQRFELSYTGTTEMRPVFDSLAAPKDLVAIQFKDRE